jgi:predicted phosphate transport protein (TIGR00153 family)
MIVSERNPRQATFAPLLGRHQMRITPRNDRFYQMFSAAADNAREATAVLVRLLAEPRERRAGLARRLKELEHRGDELTHEIMGALNTSFITPFDREDIHSLAARLDDVMDNLEETAHRFVTFRIEKPTEPAVAMARIISACCTHLGQAVQLCRDMKDVEGIQGHIREIGRLENEADQIYRESDGALFADPPDILLLIKWRELYGWLEETVDACKDVSMILSEIVIKGS